MESNRQAGVELDARLSIKFEWVVITAQSHGLSTTWEGMRLVVEEIVRRGWTVDIFFVRGQCFATIDLIESGEVKEHADTAPHAVCLAALKALEADTHE